MAKFIDKILIFLLIILIVDISLVLFKVPSYFIIAISSLLILIFLIVSYKFNNKYNIQLTYRDFIIECIKNGEDYLISYISEVLYPQSVFKKFDSYFVLNNNYYFLNLKFSPINYENLINIYKQAKSLNINKINIITTIKDRKIFNLTKYLDLDFAIMDLHPIYKKLKKLNMLKKERLSKKHSLFFIVSNIFKKSNIKYYLISSLFMFVMSYITLFKTYYLIFAIILVLLSIISCIVNIVFESKNCL